MIYSQDYTGQNAYKQNMPVHVNLDRHLTIQRHAVAMPLSTTNKERKKKD